MEKYYYERDLPHYQPPECTFFITYRLINSIPMTILRSLKEEYQKELDMAAKKIKDPNLWNEEKYVIWKRHFGRYDKYLDQNGNEPYWLKDKEIMKIIRDSLAYINEHEAKVLAYTIMPNHVHLLLETPPDALALYRILGKHKRFVARKANELLQRTGQFWEHESYDHVVRTGAFNKILQYILNNPVKAGFAANWWDWEGNFCHEELLHES